MIASSPSIPTFFGALLVPVGAVAIALSILLGDQTKLSAEQKMAFIGNCIVGVGAAVIFSGVALESTSVELSWGYWGLLAIALILLGVVFLRVRQRVPRMDGQEAAKKGDSRGSQEDSFGDGDPIQPTPLHRDVTDGSADPDKDYKGGEQATSTAHEIQQRYRNMRLWFRLRRSHHE